MRSVHVDHLVTLNLAALDGLGKLLLWVSYQNNQRRLEERTSSKGPSSTDAGMNACTSHPPHDHHHLLMPRNALKVTYAKPGRLSAGMTCAVDVAFTPKVINRLPLIDSPWEWNRVGSVARSPLDLVRRRAVLILRTLGAVNLGTHASLDVYRPG